MNEELFSRVRALEEARVKPALAIVRVGDKPDDVAYERGAVKRCDAAGIVVRRVTLPGDCAQERLIEVIEELNRDAAVHGVLLFRPLPKHMDDDAVRNALSPEKDVDGITDISLAGVFTGAGRGYPPCTAQACMEILRRYEIEPRGKRAIVIGRSLVVGKPVAMMLLGEHATVTVCHTRTVGMPSVCRMAEILVVSAGRAALVDRNYLSEGQVVIDVGINVNPNEDGGKICGDVNFPDAEAIASFVTPVPGGVGAVTTSVLAKHVVEAAEKARSAAFML
jgi:methylenetetrahydrofolate dehydrogenase (NADP+)/methenyltetrahydrofolate cyclohydrolase